MNPTVQSILADALERISEISTDDPDLMRETARVALARADALREANQAVGRIFDANDFGDTKRPPAPSVAWIGQMPPVGTELYAAPKASHGLPRHWQAVPQGPDWNMVMAGIRKGDTVNAYLDPTQASAVFTAMCEAAPLCVRDDPFGPQAERAVIADKISIFFQPERAVDQERVERCAKAVQRALSARPIPIAPAASTFVPVSSARANVCPANPDGYHPVRQGAPE